MGGPIGLALVFAGAVLFCSEWAQAATGNGPYYPTPSWDLELPVAKRFVVLKNWNREAVLDKETGLVWQQAPSTDMTTWFQARLNCLSATTGGRKGWRLPAIAELLSLMDPASYSPALPTGHPFADVQTGLLTAYWTATTFADDSTAAFYVSLINGGMGQDSKSHNYFHWCVRGGANADPY
jgi:hypothetical protein